MEQKKYDVVIAGAGPAGLKAAEILAKARKKVMVLEKNKEIGIKTCAGGLTRKNNLINLPIEKLGERIFFSFKYYYQGREKKVSSEETIIVTTEREKIGEFMKKKAEESGAKILLATPIKKISDRFIIANNKKIYFDYLIGADGSNSLVRDFLKIPSKKMLLSLAYNFNKTYENLEVFFDSKTFGSGYGSVFPHKKYTQAGITIDLGLYSMKEAKKVLDKWILKMGWKKEEGEFIAGVINYDYRGFKFGNIFLAGDAGGFAGGLTGEGIFSAALSGQEIAKKILDPKYKCPGIDHILKIKFFQEKILKKLLKIKNKQLSKLVFFVLNCWSKPSYYKVLFKLKSF